MKLKNGFITHNDGNQQIMIGAGTEFNGLVKSNQTAAFIIDCLKSETTEDEIITKMLEKYNAPKEVISVDVKKVIAELRKIGAIDD
jgi:NAD(P)H-flavin reductase